MTPQRIDQLAWFVPVFSPPLIIFIVECVRLYSSRKWGL